MRMSLRMIVLLFGRFILIFAGLGILNFLICLFFLFRPIVRNTVMFSFYFGFMLAALEAVYFWFISLYVRPYVPKKIKQISLGDLDNSNLDDIK